MDFISKFTTSMVNAGIIPKSTRDIAEAGRFRRISCESDRGGKRSISYWLKIERDFAYGYAKCFKTGQEVRFNSAIDDPGMTRGDLARVRAMLKARKAEEDIRIADRWAKIAVRAAHKWALGATGGVTPYMEAKKIGLHGARIYGGKNVIVPIMDGPQLVSWQMIDSDGGKRFPFGGKKTGCYNIVGQIDPTKPILICEGWATGVSLYQALDGRGVVVAFDAGNLLPVARAIRAIYTATPIIIAADNDESQTGQKAAAKVMAAVADVSIVMPKKIGYDFNDVSPDEIKTSFGETIGGGLLGLPESDSQSPTPADWSSSLILDGKNRIVSTSLQNAILYLLHHQDFEGVFSYDEFKQETMMTRCPPWEDESRFKVESVTDIHITQASATLERYGISCTIDKTAKAIDVVASENKFHSARQYLSALEWDGEERLGGLLSSIGCKSESTEYLSFIFKKWLTAAVKRVMEPGCKFDHVLILESQKQGLYKSEFLKTLATFNGERYHTENVTLESIDQKDTILKMQGNLIIELAELSGFSKKEDNAIKNWLTQTIDEVRIPFARKTVSYFRQFVFGATTNNYDYLRDPTGNRRYWPVTIEQAIDIEYVEEIKEQLWAEAVHWYKEKLYIGPTPAENELAELERSKRFQSDAWEEIVLTAVERVGLDEFKISDVLAKMDLKTNEKNEKATRRIGSILKANGYKNEPRWERKLGKNVRVWGK